MFALFTLPTDLVAQIGNWSSPIFTDVMQIAWLPLAIIIVVGVIGMIIHWVKQAIQHNHDKSGDDIF
jgi:hypothetical protein